MSLVAERLSWIKDFETGWEPIEFREGDIKLLLDKYLEDYIINKDSEFWRSSRYIEKVCAYELWKRGEIK